MQACRVICILCYSNKKPWKEDVGTWSVSYVSKTQDKVFRDFCHSHRSKSKTETVCSVQFSRSVMSDSLWPHESQHARPPCPSPTPGVHSNSCPLSRWCPPTILSSVILFSSCLQSFPASGSYKWVSYKNIGVSASASVLPMNIQDLFHLGWTGWLSLQSNGLSRVFSNTTVQKHQFFSPQLF